MTTPAFRFPQRQVHLDFHTSPHIPGVASEFDATAFAKTMQSAHVDSVTVFAKCHHGMCYWPANTGTVHPHLGGRDLLGLQIEALHRVGIRAPVYYTIAWEEDAAFAHPEWRQMKSDGRHARAGNHPGAWWFLNWLHPKYLDFMETQVTELLNTYPVDGWFFDIVFFDGDACWSEAATGFRARHGLLGRDAATQQRFQSAAKAWFAERFTKLVRDRKPDATVFYNGTTGTLTDARLACRATANHETHLEIESLPSGFWGYWHFPKSARQLGAWGKPWIGMTGRFQRMWGDFGGIKPDAALEYECFRSQALGGGNSVGDQLPPRGTLEPAAYDLIGRVYERCEAAERFYEGSASIRQIAIVVPHAAGNQHADADKAVEGAVQMCEETHRECAVVDDADDLTGYAAVILPDLVVPTPALIDRLAAYRKAGGKILLSHRAGFDAAGAWALPDLGLQFDGEAATWPTYLRARPEFAPDLAGSDRVCYARGMNVRGGADSVVFVDRVSPYFQRTDTHFSSHAQTPPVAHPGSFAAVIAGPGWVYFADPVFREYRQTGNLAVRDLWKTAMQRLVGDPPIGHGLPTTVLCVPRKRGKDLIVSLLHYIPLRKSLEIDIIEERMNFAGLTLRLPDTAKSVKVFGTGEALARNPDGAFALPVSPGRLLLEIPGFFVQ